MMTHQPATRPQTVVGVDWDGGGSLAGSLMSASARRVSLYLGGCDMFSVTIAGNV